MPMHPDVAAVYDSLWTPDAPTMSRLGRVSVTIRARRMSTHPGERAGAADDIATKLVPDAVFHDAGVSPINGVAYRTYFGTCVSDLAVRRG